MPLLAEWPGVRARLACVELPDAWVPRALLLLATLLVAAFWALPGLLLPVELNQDASGHMAAAQVLRDDFLPALSGWSGGFFAGFPLDRAYPPLAHAAIALLGLALPIGIALRLVLAAAVLATPLAAASLARSRGLGPTRAAFFALFVTALLCVTPGGDAMQLAGSFASLYNIGLTANAVALPLMLFAAAALPRALASRRGTLRAALLVSAAALTHLVCGLALALLCCCETAVVVARGGTRARRALVLASRLALACLALTAAWLVPFWNESGYGGVTHLPSGTPWWVVLPALLALGVMRCNRAISRRMAGTLLFTVSLTALLFLGDRLEWPMHLYRLHLFVLLGAGLCCIATWRGRRVLRAAGMLVACAAIVLSMQEPHVADLSSGDTLMIPEGPSPARVLVAAAPMHEVSRHYLQFEYPRRAGSSGLLGLFVESTPLARWVGDLSAVIEPASDVWGTPWDHGRAAGLAQDLTPEAAARDPERAAEAAGRTLRLLREFGVDAVLTDRRLPASVAAADGPVVYRFPAQGDTDPRYEIKDDAYVFRLHAVTGGAALAQPLHGPLRAMTWTDRAAWDEAVGDWLLGEAVTPRPVVARPDLDLSVADSGARVVSCDMSADGRDIVIEVTTEGDPSAAVAAAASVRSRGVDTADVPVLVRVAWHPNWRATAAGRDIPVDRVAPGFCLVRGHGTIRLHWGPTAAEQAATGLSAVAFLLACAWAGTNSLKRRAGSHRRC